MVFEDHFKNHILPDQTHILNVSFLVPEMRRVQGGCAGNIAYNLKMLGGDPLIMAAVGEDFTAYTAWLKEQDIATDHVTTIDGQFTAQMFATTDLDNNQINAFHPGAMNFAHHNKVADASGVEIAIIGPDGRDAMIQHAADLSTAGIPFFFDPGQQLPMFNGEELKTFCRQANYLIVNDYEAQMIIEKTGLSVEQLTGLVEAFVITKGGEGSLIHVEDQVIEVPSAPISEAKDPTGCGDAYRAGMLFGISKGLDWSECGKLGALCGAIKIEKPGTQGHSFTPETFAKRYQQAFGESCPIG